MLRWISGITSPRAETPNSSSSSTVSSQEPSLHETILFTDLVLAEVEQKVVEFEVEKEQSQSRERLNLKLPDYSWLVSADIRPKKYLTFQEKYKLERACERLKAEEWAQVLSNFKVRAKKASTREQILEMFATSAHEMIACRPRSVSVADVLRKYTRSSSSINAVSYVTDGERVQVSRQKTPVSARTYDACMLYDHIV